jgi:hypothetical protein
MPGAASAPQTSAPASNPAELHFAMLGSVPTERKVQRGRPYTYCRVSDMIRCTISLLFSMLSSAAQRADVVSLHTSSSSLCYFELLAKKISKFGTMLTQPNLIGELAKTVPQHSLNI